MAGTNANTMDITAPVPRADSPTGPPPGFPTAEFQREARLASAVMFATDIVNAHAPTQPATGRQDLGGEQPADPRTPAPLRAAPGSAHVEDGEIDPAPPQAQPTIITPDSQARQEPSRRITHAAAGFHRFLRHHVTAYPNLAALMGPQHCVAWLDSFLSAITPLVDEYLAIANPSLGDAQTLLDADAALTARRNSLLTTMASLPARQWPKSRHSLELHRIWRRLNLPDRPDVRRLHLFGKLPRMRTTGSHLGQCLQYRTSHMCCTVVMRHLTTFHSTWRLFPDTDSCPFLEWFEKSIGKSHGQSTISAISIGTTTSCSGS
jgi:hypothetical protein